MWIGSARKATGGRPGKKSLLPSLTRTSGNSCGQTWTRLFKIHMRTPKNKRRTVNRSQVRLADPDSDWITLRPRQTRTQRQCNQFVLPATRTLPEIEPTPPTQPNTYNLRTRSGIKRPGSGPDDTTPAGKRDRTFGPLLLQKRKPSGDEQETAKRLCIAAVRFYCS